MDECSGSESEDRKLKTLAFYFHQLQLTGEDSFEFSYLIREVFDDFKSYPLHWSSINRYFQF